MGEYLQCTEMVSVRFITDILADVQKLVEERVTKKLMDAGGGITSRTTVPRIWWEREINIDGVRDWEVVQNMSSEVENLKNGSTTGSAFYRCVGRV